MSSKTPSCQEFALPGVAATIYTLYILLNDPLTIHTYRANNTTEPIHSPLPPGSERYGTQLPFRHRTCCRTKPAALTELSAEPRSVTWSLNVPTSTARSAPPAQEGDGSVAHRGIWKKFKQVNTKTLPLKLAQRSDVYSLHKVPWFKLL